MTATQKLDDAIRATESLVFYLAQSGSEGPALSVTKRVARERANVILAMLRETRSALKEI